MFLFFPKIPGIKLSNFDKNNLSHRIMKRKITSLLLVAGTMLTMNAQVVFQENFTAPFNPATAGWDASQNLSAPIGTLTPNWFQGNTTQMTALSGAPADYFAVDFRSTATTGT